MKAKTLQPVIRASARPRPTTTPPAARKEAGEGGGAYGVNGCTLLTKMLCKMCHNRHTRSGVPCIECSGMPKPR